MLSDEKLKVLLAWKNNEFSKYCIKDIMDILNKQSKPWVFETLKILCEYNFLIKSQKSNLNIYSLNIHNQIVWKTLNYFNLLENYPFPEIETTNILIKTIPYSNYCLIVFGSYVDSKHTSKSDLDICILSETKEDIKKIKPYVEELKLEIELDPYYFTKHEFLEMLLNDEENLGKQIQKKHLILFNEDVYFDIIKKAYKNGFRY